MREHKNLPDAAGYSGQLWKLRGIQKEIWMWANVNLSPGKKSRCIRVSYGSCFIFVLSTAVPRFLHI